MRSDGSQRLRARRERHRQRHLVVRVGVALSGFLLLFGGVLMLVLPGPGIVVAALGLGLLALEFAWAERALGQALSRTARAQEQARRLSVRRRLYALAFALAAACLLVAALLSGLL